MLSPWMLLIVGSLFVWIGLKNKATDLVNAVLNNASPYKGTSTGTSKPAASVTPGTLPA